MTGINTGATGLKTFAELYGTGYQPTGGPISTPALQNNAPQALAPNLTQDGENSLEKSPKSDTITIAGKTINKKTAIKAGLGALAAAAVIGIGVFAFKGRGKTPPIPTEPPVPTPAPAPVPEGSPLDPAKLADELQASANEMFQRANEMKETAQKKIDAVVELFQNGGKDSKGNVIAKITDKAEGSTEKVMQEFAEDGTTVTRESIFKNGILAKITEFLEGGKENRAIFRNNEGKLTIYIEGADGNKTAKMLNMEAGLYREGIETGDTTKIARSLNWHKGEYAENTEENFTEGIKKVLRALRFNEERTVALVTDIEAIPGKPTRQNLFQLNEDGIWQKFEG